MASPVQLSDLPVGNLALSNDPTAVTLMRVGLTDYQVAVNIIRNINLQSLQTLPNGTPIQTDLMMVNRIVSGTPSNFQVTFGQVGFPVATRLWFYNSLPPAPNWKIVPNTGGNLLAVNDTVTKYSGEGSPGVSAGTWQQSDHVLTIAELPAHDHDIKINAADKEGAEGIRVGSTLKGNAYVFTNNVAIQNTGGGAGHNHGNTWRPLANVGIIGEKAY